jgi:hypothetical protein
VPGIQALTSLASGVVAPKFVSSCRSLLAGDFLRIATDFIPNRLQAGSYIRNSPSELS